MGEDEQTWPKLTYLLNFSVLLYCLPITYVRVINMEKRTPHHHLSLVKELLSVNKVKSTHSALRGAAELGLSFTEICDVVAQLTGKHFYKSMTTYADHRIWHDVYKVTIQDLDNVYLKLSIENANLLIIVSFKSDESS